MHHLHSNLKHLRSLRGYNAAIVAGAIDVKRSTLSGWENGYSEPGCEALVKLGEYYRLSLDLLIKEDLVKMPNSTIAQLQRGY